MASLPNLHGSCTILQVWLVSPGVLYSALVMHCHCISLQHNPELMWQGNGVVTVGAFSGVMGHLATLVCSSHWFGYSGWQYTGVRKPAWGRNAVHTTLEHDTLKQGINSVSFIYWFCGFICLFCWQAQQVWIWYLFLKMSFQGGGPVCLFSSGLFRVLV